MTRPSAEQTIWLSTELVSPNQLGGVECGEVEGDDGQPGSGSTRPLRASRLLGGITWLLLPGCCYVITWLLSCLLSTTICLDSLSLVCLDSLMVIDSSSHDWMVTTAFIFGVEGSYLTSISRPVYRLLPLSYILRTRTQYHPILQPILSGSSVFPVSTPPSIPCVLNLVLNLVVYSIIYLFIDLLFIYYFIIYLFLIYSNRPSHYLFYFIYFSFINHLLPTS